MELHRIRSMLQLRFNQKPHSTSTQRQIQRHWRIRAIREAVMNVKGFGFLGFGINQQGIRPHLCTGFQATVNRKAYQQRAYARALVRQAACQTPHAKAWHGVARQLFLLSIREKGGVNLSGAECIETQNLAGLGIIHHHKDRAEALGALLRRILAEIVIQRRFTTTEAEAVMDVGV